MKLRTAALALAATFAGALPAWAHEGDHEGLSNLAALRHLLTEPDHLLVVGLVVLLLGVPVVRLALRRVRR